MSGEAVRLDAEQRQQVYDMHDEGLHPSTIWCRLGLPKELVEATLRNRPSFTRRRPESA